MFLSVVIPVYNCEPYLPECLDSLLDQDLDKSEYEIICVNDGSTDGSLAILRRYADREQNVKVLEQTNQGVCSARNHGMGEAKGDYVWFVDADDFIQRNILGKLKRIACEAPNERISMSGYYIMSCVSSIRDSLCSTKSQSIFTVRDPVPRHIQNRRKNCSDLRNHIFWRPGSIRNCLTVRIRKRRYPIC